MELKAVEVRTKSLLGSGGTSLDGLDEVEDGVGGSLDNLGVLGVEINSVELVEGLILLKLGLVHAESIDELGPGLERGEGNTGQNVALQALGGNFHSLAVQNSKITCIG